MARRALPRGAGRGSGAPRAGGPASKAGLVRSLMAALAGGLLLVQALHHGLGPARLAAAGPDGGGPGPEDGPFPTAGPAAEEPEPEEPDAEAGGGGEEAGEEAGATGAGEIPLWETKAADRMRRARERKRHRPRREAERAAVDPEAQAAKAQAAKILDLVGAADHVQGELEDMRLKAKEEAAKKAAADLQLLLKQQSEAQGAKDAPAPPGDEPAAAEAGAEAGGPGEEEEDHAEAAAGGEEDEFGGFAGGGDPGAEGGDEDEGEGSATAEGEEGPEGGDRPTGPEAGQIGGDTPAEEGDTPAAEEGNAEGDEGEGDAGAEAGGAEGNEDGGDADTASEATRSGGGGGGAAGPAEAKCVHGREEEGGTCACKAWFEGPRCGTPKVIEDEPGLKYFAGSLLWDHKYLTRLGMSMAAGNSKVSIKVTTPTEIFSLIDELSPQMYGALSQLLPQKDPSSNFAAKRCAIVGSSGSLLRKEWGAEIDAHDYVLRFNRAPTRGYTAFVGARTDLRFTDADSVGFREGDELLVYTARSQTDILKLMLYKRHFEESSLFILSPEYMEAVAELVDALPRKGTLAAMFALQMCEAVTLYGFAAAERQGARYHYYDKAVAPLLADVHTKEYRLLETLGKAGLLRFAEPCVAECQAGLAACSACLDMPVPLLLRSRTFTPEQTAANEAAAAAWEEFQTWEQKSLPLELDAAPKAGAGARGGQRRRKRPSKKEEKVPIVIQLGWEYVLSSGRIDALKDADLDIYFAQQDLDPPASRLEKILMIKDDYARRRGGGLGGRRPPGGHLAI